MLADLGEGEGNGDPMNTGYFPLDVCKAMNVRFNSHNVPAFDMLDLVDPVTGLTL
jgi:hypothetical protein